MSPSPISASAHLWQVLGAPGGSQDAFLWLIVTLSLIMLTVSAGACALIIVRRVGLNHRLAERERHKAAFRAALGEHFSRSHSAPDDPVLAASFPDCHVSDMSDVLLHHLRVLRGTQAEQLRQLVTDQGWEQRIARSTKSGTRGARMRALRVLSYLETSESLRLIHEHLDAKQPYVRLTAARALVRRDATMFLGHIVASYSDVFPDQVKGLAELLSGFGAKITDDLEEMAERTDRPVVLAASLEALIMNPPRRVRLDLCALMNHLSDDVRAAACALSCVSEHPGAGDPLRMGLKDDAPKVRLRAAKAACENRESGFVGELYALARDPIFWARYWAFRAIWATGDAGRQFVESCAKREPMAADVSLEMRAADMRAGHV